MLWEARNFGWQWLRLAFAASLVLGLADCSCGVGADSGAPPSDAGTIASDGSAHFTTIASGATETFPIPVKESADTNETIVSASLSGSGAAAFQILAQFPLQVPEGQDVPVNVQFAPTAAGVFEAQLLLQTAKMGTSQISLVGTATE